MTTINLHDYLDRINKLLDESRLREVTGHCRHILSTYPQHIDTYRMLAKSMLEKEVYDDARNLFHRVLSADPSDFIAHVGLSIIFKEESLLPQAIWHLERAFETQPYNAAIQVELRDLYRLNGLPVPSRLPLTGAALARLYLQSEMYRQAAVELRHALEAHPDRMDLAVLLAETLWRDNQRVDAVDVCREVLDELPNCIAANAILADIWLVTGRTEEAKSYLQKVQRLTRVDQQHLDVETAVGRALTADGAPDLPETVTIEHLERDAASQLDGKADWVSEVDGDATETTTNYDDWLSGFGTDEAAAETDETVVTADPARAGALASSEWFIDEVIAPTEEPASDTVVDKEESPAEKSFPDVLEEEEMTDWLMQLDEEPLIPGDAEETAAPQTGSFDWLEEEKAVSDTAGESFDWLDEAEDERTQPEESQFNRQQPDITADMFADSAVTDSLAADMPDWLSDVSENDMNALLLDPDEAQEWLSDDEEADAPAPAPAANQPNSETPGWLANTSTGTDWLSPIEEEPAADDSPEPEPPVQDKAKTAAEDMPDWLLSTEMDEQDLETLADTANNQDKTLVQEMFDDVDSKPAWLNDSAPLEDTTAAPLADESAEDFDTVDVPNWLRDDVTDSSPQLEEPVISEPEDKNPEEPIEPESDPSIEQGTDDLDDAMAWLEDLASGDEAENDDGEAATAVPETPADSEEEVDLPDWLATADGLDMMDEAVPTPADELPDWLENMAPAPEEESATGDEAEEDWLADLAAPTGDITPVEEPPTWKWDQSEVGETPVDETEEPTAVTPEPEPEMDANESTPEPVAEGEDIGAEDVDFDTAAWFADMAAGSSLAGGAEENEDAISFPTDDADLETAVADTSDDIEDDLDWLEDLALEQDQIDGGLPSTLNELDSFITPPEGSTIEGEPETVAEETPPDGPEPAIRDESEETLSLTALLDEADLPAEGEAELDSSITPPVGDTIEEAPETVVEEMSLDEPEPAFPSQTEEALTLTALLDEADLPADDEDADMAELLGTLPEDSELELDWLADLEIPEEEEPAVEEPVSVESEQPAVEPLPESFDADPSELDEVPDWLTAIAEESDETEPEPESSEMVEPPILAEVELTDAEEIQDATDSVASAPEDEPQSPTPELETAVASDEEFDAFDFFDSIEADEAADELPIEDELATLFETEEELPQTADRLGDLNVVTSDLDFLDLDGTEEAEATGEAGEAAEPAITDTTSDVDESDIAAEPDESQPDAELSQEIDALDFATTDLGFLFSDEAEEASLDLPDEEDTEGAADTAVTEPERQKTGFTDALDELDNAEAWLDDLADLPDEFGADDETDETAEWLDALTDPEETETASAADAAEATETDELANTLTRLESLARERGTADLPTDSATVAPKDNLDAALDYLDGILAPPAADTAVSDVPDTTTDEEASSATAETSAEETVVAADEDEDPMAMLEGLLGEDLDFGLDDDAPAIEPGEGDDDFGFFGMTRAGETEPAAAETAGEVEPAGEDTAVDETEIAVEELETAVAAEVDETIEEEDDDEDPMAMLEGLLGEDLDFGLDDDAPAIEPGEGDDDFGFFGMTRAAEVEPAGEDTAVDETEIAVEELETAVAAEVDETIEEDDDDEDPMAMLEGLLGEDLDFGLDDDAPAIEPGEGDDDFGFFGMTRAGETEPAAAETAVEVEPAGEDTAVDETEIAVEELETAVAAEVDETIEEEDDDEDPMAMLEGLLGEDLDFGLDDDAPAIEPGEGDDDFGFFGMTRAAEAELPAPAVDNEAISEETAATTPEIIEEPLSASGELNLDDDMLADMPDDPDEVEAWLNQLAARQSGDETARTVEDGNADAEPTPPAATDPVSSEAPSPTDGDEEDIPNWLLDEDESSTSMQARAGWLDELADADVDSWLSEQDEVAASGIDETRIEERNDKPATGPLPEISPPAPPAPPPVEAPPSPDDSLILPPDTIGASALAADSDRLSEAREAVAAGDLDTVVTAYQILLEQGEGLVTLITDLETAVDSHPTQPTVRRLLGDAYMRNGQLQRALEVYRQALDQL